MPMNSCLEFLLVSQLCGSHCRLLGCGRYCGCLLFLFLPQLPRLHYSSSGGHAHRAVPLDLLL